MGVPHLNNPLFIMPHFRYYDEFKFVNLPPGIENRLDGMKTPLCKKGALAGPGIEQFSNLVIDLSVCGISQILTFSLHFLTESNFDK